MPVVRAAREIDLANVGEFEGLLQAAIEKSPCGLLVDMSQVRYLDVSGLKAILRVYQQVYSAGGAVALVMEGIVRKLFEVVSAGGFPGLLICENTQAALEKLSSYLDEIG